MLRSACRVESDGRRPLVTTAGAVLLPFIAAESAGYEAFAAVESRMVRGVRVAVAESRPALGAPAGFAESGRAAPGGRGGCSAALSAATRRLRSACAARSA